MSVEFTVADNTGKVVFDINKHRLIRYINSPTIKAAQWYRHPTNTAMWYADYAGIAPKTHMCTTANIVVVTNRLQYYNQYAPTSTNPGDQVADIYGI